MATQFAPAVVDYLHLLANQFPTIAAASSEIVNLSAIQALPAPTEQYISDLHGVVDAVDHQIRNGSGSIRRTIESVFRFSVSPHQRQELATLIYYPREKLQCMLKEREQRLEADELLRSAHCDNSTPSSPSSEPISARGIRDADAAFYQLILYRLVVVARIYSSRYTRSHVRKVLQKECPDFVYILEELLEPLESEEGKRGYMESIMASIIVTGSAVSFIVAITGLIRSLAIDRLFVVGDIFDRGSHAHLLLERLMSLNHVTLEFGNHDVLWLGAACGSDACIANVLRVSLRYGLFETMERFGINLVPLLTFARATYRDDPCTPFMPRGVDLPEPEARDAALMHKAIAVIQFKLEAHVSRRHPCWNMDRRNLLHKIQWGESPLRVELPDPACPGQTRYYEMKDSNFPTITPGDEYRLTPEEHEVVLRLRRSFLESRTLQQGAHWLFEHGAMCHIHNDLLLFHGGIPVHEDGSFKKVQLYDYFCSDGSDPNGACKTDGDHELSFSGPALFDVIDRCIRDAFYLKGSEGELAGADDQYTVRLLHTSTEIMKCEQPRDVLAQLSRLEPSHRELQTRQVFGRDLAWWLWCGPDSPLFGRDRMATFENYFIADKEACREHAVVYYKLREQRESCEYFLQQWGLDPQKCRIVCGHTPIRTKSGEQPMKAEGRCIVIDGGFATPDLTGVAGFTLIADANQLTLQGHSPFIGRQVAIETNADMISDSRVLERYPESHHVRDTDVGARIQKKIEDLTALLQAYKLGIIKQQ